MNKTIIEGLLSADELFKFSGKHKTSGKWDIGEQVKSEKWDKKKPVKLLLREGSTTLLTDGNKRISYLARNGAGEMMIPVVIEVEP